MLKTIFRWLGITIGGLLGLIILLVGGVYLWAGVRMSSTYSIAPQPLTVSIADGDIERGKHLVAAVGKCVDCHGQNLAGSVMIDDPLLGRLAGSNLTRGQGGVGATYSDIDWVRAIRHGVGPDGRGLKVMPSSAYYEFSDQDLASIIAYLKSLPPVDNTPPTNDVRILGRALYVGGVLPLIHAEMVPHAAPRPEAPTIGVTKEYGRYLTVTGGCADCHGARLAGGTVPGSGAEDPPAPNLTPGGELAGWTEADLRRALREGKTPTGRQLSEMMPWKATKDLTDDEIAATWLYLQSLPPLKHGENQ